MAAATTKGPESVESAGFTNRNVGTRRGSEANNPWKGCGQVHGGGCRRDHVRLLRHEAFQAVEKAPN